MTEGLMKMSPLTKASQSVILTVIARSATVLTPIIFGGVIWLSQQWLDQRFNAVLNVATQAADTATAAGATAQKAHDDLLQMSGHMNVIDANMVSGQNDRVDFQNQTLNYQKQMTREVDKLTDIVTATSNQVSAISATLNDQRRADIRPSTALP